SPARAIGANISIVDNINREELLKGMLTDEMDNGFANRFLWACSKRSKSLPEGGRLFDVDFTDLQIRFNKAKYASKTFEAVVRDEEASDIWGRDDKPSIGVYNELTREREGMFSKCTAR